MRPFLAVLRVTIAEAVRSRVAAALVLGLALALLGLAAEAKGDGTVIGRERAFLAAALDATWALLGLAAVFLSTASLSRELEDGRAIPIGVTPARSLAILGGKCAGIVAVLAVVLALALAWALGVVVVRTRGASPADRTRVETELLTARAQIEPPRLDAQSPAVIERAQARLAAIGREGLPPGMSPETALKKILDDEVVRTLSVAPGHAFTWELDPQDPVPDAGSITLRFKYRTVPPLLPGKGPSGVFTLTSGGVLVGEWPVTASPGAPHELTESGHYLSTPLIRAPGAGKVTRIAGTTISIDGSPAAVPEGYTFLVSEGDLVQPDQVIARADKLHFKVTYENREPGIVVVFPPEGVALLHPDRSIAANFAAAFALILGRLVFLTAWGLALSTFLEGRVAALATFFVLAVAAAHGFLDDAVGPVLASPIDNVFGPLDVPVKALLRAVLWLLPDLGSSDAGEALAQGRVVLGAVPSVYGLAVFAGGAALALGSAVLARRELAA